MREGFGSNPGTVGDDEYGGLESDIAEWRALPGGWPETRSGAYAAQRAPETEGRQTRGLPAPRPVSQTPAASRARRSRRISRPTVTF